MEHHNHKLYHDDTLHIGDDHRFHNDIYTGFCGDHFHGYSDVSCSGGAVMAEDFAWDQSLLRIFCCKRRFLFYMKSNTI